MFLFIIYFTFKLKYINILSYIKGMKHDYTQQHY